MKAIVVLAASGAAVGGLYLGGAFEGGEIYRLPIAEARARLQTVTLPQPIKATAGGSTADLSIDGSSDTFTWRIRAGTDAVALFSAHLLAEGPQRTRVVLDYKNLDTKAPWADRLMSTSFMRSYAESSFHEQVDAALEARPADQRRAMQAFAIHAAAHPEQIREVGLATQGIFKDVAEQLKSTQAGDQFGAYGQYSQYNPDISQISTREQMRAATRPNYQATRPSTELPRD